MLNSVLIIDREFIKSLTLKIDKDKAKFHLFPYHQHNFIYSLDVSNESLVYLTYNINSIIKAEYANHTEIFTASMAFWDINSPHWMGAWYINFTLIPTTPNYNSTKIILNDVFLVKMNLHYYSTSNSWDSQFLTIEQYLIFNSNFQTMLVFSPTSALAVQ